MSKRYKKNMLAEIEAANQKIAKDIAETLNVHYPNHAWAVNADVKQGIVVIYNNRLSGEMGFLLHMADLINDHAMKLVIKSGGEFLERYNIARGEFKERDLFSLKKDFKGDFLHE